MVNESYIKQAVKLAAERQGFCAPNPAVGAVLMKDGQFIAQGAHFACGHAHAEVVAIQKAGTQAVGATLYVSLEPCCHQGRTPPCTDSILQAGIKQVYYAYRDPNPAVAGKGETTLRAAGVDCQYSPCVEADEFYLAYQYWWQHKKPRVTCKLALSLDGKIAGEQGRPIQITGDQTQVFTHHQRMQHDALLTSVQTIIKDNPQMNVRLAGQATISKTVYLLDRQLRLPLDAQIWQTTQKIVLFHQAEVDEKVKAALQQQGADCVQVQSDGLHLDLNEVLAYIGQQGKHSLWVEAGSQLTQSFLTQSLVQQAYFYLATKSLGSKALQAFSEQLDLTQTAKSISWGNVGTDGLCQIVWA